MPDKTLTVATYAAGASLAAITLIYVFAPTYFLDSDVTKKKGVVGLSNPANDCFINSILQALAGLGDLRIYLIRETHRRSLDDGLAYLQQHASDTGGATRSSNATIGPAPASYKRNIPNWKLEGLQRGIVTKGLKDILDSLNERPIYKKTISAAPFVATLELAFGQRISRQQQDAQEFLQVVAERLCDEFYAGCRARSLARQSAASTVAQGESTAEEQPSTSEDGPGADDQVPLEACEDHTASSPERTETTAEIEDADTSEDYGFPLEGKMESQIECLTCKFKPRPTQSTFCSLTLNVPHVSSTTLNACFDGMFKTEYIDDFKCEKCRLVHAVSVLEAEAAKSTSEPFKAKTRAAIESLGLAINTDPEKPPPDVALPDLRYAPKRKIARHTRLTVFPKIMAVHLSRSIFDASNFSQKNTAKVTFPEQLPLGGLLHQKQYKLLGLVTHKGSHNSGHYETFRRQNTQPPFSNSHTFQPSGVFAKTTNGSGCTSAHVGTIQGLSEQSSASTSSSALASSEPANSVSVASPLGSGMTSPFLPATSASSTSRERESDGNSLRPVATSARPTLSRITLKPSSRTASPVSAAQGDTHNPKSGHSGKPKRQRQNNRWWRISDDKIKEASTRDVLSMQREVYLLFYELEK